MKKENILLILWIIFGFLFISAIDSVLYFVVHLTYFAQAELGISYNIMKVTVPIITTILYALTTIILIKKLKTKSKNNGIYLTKFPKNLIIILGLTAFLLAPITNKLSGLYAERIATNEAIGMSEYINFYGWFQTGIGISQISIMIILLVIYITKLKSMNNN